ncbi:hypothetical protein HIM_01403 [Hirsutella minnesotensis 3608]|nr:hypothetical protein HIM_01403 [Hirsutella minnesotensis 3608]
MRADTLYARALGPLLVFSGHAAAQEGQNVIVNELERISDPLQGPFRTFYSFSMGNQSIKALYDTGSSDLVVPQTGAPICNIELQQCNEKAKTGFVTGSFDAGAAQVQNLSIPLNATFTGGAAFTGTFVQTPVKIGEGGDVNLQVGVVQGGSPPAGGALFSVMGVGPIQGESTGPQGAYPNLVAKLKEEGKIKVNAFGLYVGSYNGQGKANVVWGGFDEAKFEGQLKAMPLAPDNRNEIPSFVVNWSSVKVASKNPRCVPNGEGGRGSGNEQGRGEEGRRKQGTGGAQTGPDAPSEQNREQGPGNVRSASRGYQYAVAGNARFASKQDSGHRLQKRAGSKGPAWRRNVAIRARSLNYDHLIPRSSDISRRQQDGNLKGDDGPPVTLLDTGGPDINLSRDTVASIAKELGTQVEGEGIGLVDCECANGGTSLIFGFENDSVTIEMPLKNIVLGPEFNEPPDFPGNSTRGTNSTARAERPKDAQGREGCQLAISVNDPKLSPPVLGGAFLQSAYTVFDMESKIVLMAQAKPEATESKPREYVPGAQNGISGSPPGAGRGQEPQLSNKTQQPGAPQPPSGLPKCKNKPPGAPSPNGQPQTPGSTNRAQEPGSAREPTSSPQKPRKCKTKSPTLSSPDSQGQSPELTNKGQAPGIARGSDDSTQTPAKPRKCKKRPTASPASNPQTQSPEPSPEPAKKAASSPDPRRKLPKCKKR